MASKRVGLFFGSFNPIHVGHLIIANYMVEHSALDEVWFVVSPQNPFKKKASLLDERQRLYMVNLAIEENYSLKASSVEFTMPVPSYTIDTLVYLAEKHPSIEFALIMGADNLVSLPKWKNYQQILSGYHVYVYPRPGSTLPALAEHESVTVVNAPQMLLSASHIRKELQEGHSIQYLVTEPVRKYIEEMHFYKT